MRGWLKESALFAFEKMGEPPLLRLCSGGLSGFSLTTTSTEPMPVLSMLSPASRLLT